MSHGFRPAAVIFDLDGTLVDNMALHAEAFAEFGRRHGLPPLAAADRARLDGRRNSEIFPDLFARPVGRAEWEGYEAEKESIYRDLSRGRLAPVPGLSALLAWLDARAIPVALATSAPALNVEHTLGEAGLAGAFATIVRGDEVRQGKPAPDVFLEAARRLGIEPRHCLVVEDAPMGIMAAQAAGIPVVALATSFPVSTLEALTPPPAAVCADYTDLQRHLAD